MLSKCVKNFSRVVSRLPTILLAMVMVMSHSTVAWTGMHRTGTSMHAFQFRMQLTPTTCWASNDGEIIENDGLLEQQSTLLIDSDDDLDVPLEGEDDCDQESLPMGLTDGFYVIKTYTTPSDNFDLFAPVLAEVNCDRLDITRKNVTLPLALMLMDPQEYPSLSRARKACRKGQILIHSGQLSTNDLTAESTTAFSNSTRCLIGRVGDRVCTQDVLAKQIRMGNGRYPVMGHKQPPFEVPIVYEDDHFAIVNKPAGVVVYSHKNAGHGIMTIRSALPFVITPPKKGTYAVLRRPQSVHRLDKPTSGLLLIAKTKPAMVALSMQFVERKVKKTYHAIVNGIPFEPRESSISPRVAHELGVDVPIDYGIDTAAAAVAGDNSINSSNSNINNTNNSWQLIDDALEEKSAVTVWRAKQYGKSLKAKDGHFTLVEVKPKTGRYHQIRRHMAWVCECPLVGDSEYDGGGVAMSFRDRGLMLCSTKVSLEHPYFNTDQGRKEWDNLDTKERYKHGVIALVGGTVMVTASIDLPAKFGKFLAHEEKRAELLH